MISARELRIKVLEDSLEFESQLSFVLSRLFKVSEDARLFGDTSSALSFQTKVDFLNDLGRLSKEQYNYFFLFMEIRNKVIHNLHIDSLEKTIKKIGKAKLFFSLDTAIKQAYDDSVEYEAKELNLFKLYEILINILTESISEISNQIAISINEEEKVREKEILLNNRGVLIKCFYKASSQLFNDMKQTIAPDTVTLYMNNLSRYFLEEIDKNVKREEAQHVSDDLRAISIEMLIDMGSKKKK